jgi:hypothetical protein
VRSVGTRRVDRIVVGVLASLTALVSAKTLVELMIFYPYGVDLEIPLRAASRWLAGGEPYVPGAFDVVAGPDLPFLYPPVVLPFVAVLLAIPRIVLFPVWTALCVGAGVFACRRLGIPWVAVPVILIWPPFAEALLGGNVHVPLFAAFVAVVYAPPEEAFRPRPRDPAKDDRPATVDGFLAALVAAIKVSLAHTWLFVLRHRPRGALIGGALIVGLVLLTLPAVGFPLWSDWLGQASRSGDPNWHAVGWPLSRLIGRPLGLIVTAITLGAVFVIPVRRAGAWLGLLTVIGAPSLHVFGLIFLLPAMLEVRRDVALTAALLIATYTEVGLVSGTALAMVAFALMHWLPVLRRPRLAQAA